MKYTEGWNKTAAGEVYLNEFGRVVRSTANQKTVYPYRWRNKLGVWTCVSGEYKPAYLAKLIRENQVRWF